jgi:hypothetical protein
MRPWPSERPFAASTASAPMTAGTDTARGVDEAAEMASSRSSAGSRLIQNSEHRKPATSPIIASTTCCLTAITAGCSAGPTFYASKGERNEPPAALALPALNTRCGWLQTLGISRAILSQRESALLGTFWRHLPVISCCHLGLFSLFSITYAKIVIAMPKEPLNNLPALAKKPAKHKLRTWVNSSQTLGRRASQTPGNGILKGPMR